MNIFGIAVFCLISAILSLVLRQYKGEYALLISLACSVVVMLFIMDGIAQVRDQLDAVLQTSLLNSELVGIVFRCLGVCILTELAGQSCRDAGEGAIAAKVELAGKIALLLMSLPLFLRLLDVSAHLLAL